MPLYAAARLGGVRGKTVKRGGEGGGGGGGGGREKRGRDEVYPRSVDMLVCTGI